MLLLHEGSSLEKADKMSSFVNTKFDVVLVTIILHRCSYM
jgi:hypothetical protein